MSSIEVTERSVTLPAEPSSARDARRFVHGLLENSGHPEWQEAAALAVSEIVTNAVLHAHTPLTLTVVVTPHSLRIEVLDHNPTPPTVPRYDRQATTGRGMSLVAAVTTTHGVTPLGADGKIVWFTLGDEPTDQDLDDLLDGWDDEEVADGTAVTLVGMPVMLWIAAREHHDALLRELTLHRAADPASDPASRAALVQADLARDLIWSALGRDVARAGQPGPFASGRAVPGSAILPEVPARLDLVLSVPPDAAELFAQLQDVLDEAEALAVADRLLVRPGLPEIVAVRDWACEQVISQLSGTAPTPWPGAEALPVVAAAPTQVEDLGWDPSPVLNSREGAVAADDGNRIVAVNRVFSDALGWESDALVGKRVVALVPPRLREAHVAGFTRHLTTGEAHVLGVPLELPVLRPDGSEVVCSFLIESKGTATGRTVYTAWITPLRQ